MTHPDMSQGETAYAKLLEAIRAGTHALETRFRETNEDVTLNLSRTPMPKVLHNLSLIHI